MDGRARPRRRPCRRGAGGELADVTARPALRAGDTLLMDTACGPAAREAAPARGRGVGARGGARHLLQRHRRPRRADRADHRRGRAAVPAQPTCSPSTSCRRPRASCCTARPAAARRSSPRRWPTRWPRRWPEKTGADSRSYFINIKGPELLNKYVGETERHIRLVFQRAREKARRARRSSCSSTRWSRCSAPAERASPPTWNRRSCPAAGGDRRRRDAAQRDRDRRLQPRGPDRPGHPAAGPPRREDQDRTPRPRRQPPDLRLYLTDDLPLDESRSRSWGAATRKGVQAMIEAAVEEMYRDDEDNQFLEVTYQNGDKEIMYFKDFSSGAMIENIVRRAKKLAIKRELAGGQGRGAARDLLASIARSTRSTRTCPTPPTPTTGRRSRARRASGSCTCERW
jgi:hypothetical protein